MTSPLRQTAAAFAVLAALAAPGRCLASGGNYVFDGGTPAEQAQVRSALDASSFDWSAIPEQITITIAPSSVSQSVPGHIYLDSNLLDQPGDYSWGVVQNEYAHQVHFFLLNDDQRAQLTQALGATAWCYGDQPNLTLEQAGCERFASTLAVSYWQSPDNCIRGAKDVAPIAGAQFRNLLEQMLGSAATPTSSPTPSPTVTSYTTGTRVLASAKQAHARPASGTGMRRSYV
ncbi:MAG: hypothetical protein JO064_07925 [Actinobacteria bacterium]|nr:hypothetical protein [Actinomycetota bacterium]